MSHREHGTRAHGSRAKYVVERCRCDQCRAACATYERHRTRQRGYGRTAFVDAEPVRAHLRALSAAGVGYRRAAQLAGISPSTVGRIIYGYPSRGTAPSKGVRTETAAALLSVTTAGAVSPGVRVPAVGAQRRLQALMALGWSQAKLAHQLGMHPGNLNRLLHARTAANAGTARAVRALYDRLWSCPPPEASHRDRIAASRSRNYARAHGWAPPMAWDDDTIDDPSQQPAGARTTPGRADVDPIAVDQCAAGRIPFAALNTAERRAVVNRLTAAGLSIAATAQRVHANPDAIAQQRVRANARARAAS